MQSFDQDAPTERIATPPLAASALKSPRERQSLPLAQSEASLPFRRSHPTAASLYASTLSPPSSRPQSPNGRPLATRNTSDSVFGAALNNGIALAAGVGDSPGDPLNLILHAFVPHVAVYTSEDTDDLLREKGFDRGLWELLRPFGERVQGKVIIRDSNGASRTFDDYSLHFAPFGEGIVHPEPVTAGLKNATQAFRTNGASEKATEAARASRGRTTIAEVEAVVDRHLNYAEDSYFGTAYSATDHGLDTDVPSPYYALYLRRLLSGMPLTPHETFAHPVACVIAISSRNEAPIETLRQLYTQSSTGDKSLPNWVDNEYLRYYVLVHDEEKDDITRSVSLFDQMKRSLGLHCHLLRIRGTQSLATDDDSIPLPRSEWMSASEELANLRNTEDQEGFENSTRYIFGSDATAIRSFIREMVTQSIIPTMERHVSVWNDQVASKRRGLAGRFVGLTRRFGFGNTTRTGPTGSSYDPLGFYRSDTPEAILRKMADYAFMLRDWKLAHSTYEMLRSDFNSDKAWRYHAAANEMAALSLLIMPQNLSSKARAETVDAMFEAASYSYLTRCSAPYGVVRCLALGLELLRLRGGSNVDDAAKWGIRLLESKTMGPVGDALIKERLAVCYAFKQGLGSQGWGSRRRKSGLWSILGAETWLAQSKYIQAQRCLNEARKTYAGASTGDEEHQQQHGIDRFRYASSFMLHIGQQLNDNLTSPVGGGGGGDDAEDDDDDDDGEAGGRQTTTITGEQSETVDEESEALGTGERGRRMSSLYPSGVTALNLESAPLRSQETGLGLSEERGAKQDGAQGDDDNSRRDPLGAQDDFG